ncbi:hypothetical protein [Flavivirga spongiicola]|uniref:Uncharacterized protein n=1 Tax=Flavivirga spongiicola TaxID=421621 RepID=A0ABU7XT63_9FLAO|nr:hypothetical protein [Flavivirga sp. MEBiC05379]MDO5978692.1 hypothetical protein [Flavivirga sp. MEBiC05379]
MTEEVIRKLILLKQSPADERVDHIALLYEIYWEFSNGISELKPVAMFYLNGFDNLPALKEKKLWNLDKYNEIMKPFFDSHSELKKLVNDLLKSRSNIF